MSLNVPIITGGKALELASLGSSSDGYPNIHTPIAPFGKTTLDSSKHCVASGFRRTPEESDRTTPITERPRELVALRKQGK